MDLTDLGTKMVIFGQPGTPPFPQPAVEDVLRSEADIMDENASYRFEEAGLEVVQGEKARMAQMAHWADYAWFDEAEDGEVEMAQWADGAERAAQNKIAAQAIRATKEQEMRKIR